MLKFYCTGNEFKKVLTKKIIDEFAKVEIEVGTKSNGYAGEFNIHDEQDGLSLSGMKYCTIEAGPPFSMSEYDDAIPGDALRAIKEAYPDVEIKGSLLFGDDDFRQQYWYGSESGSTDVVEDYAIVDMNDDDFLFGGRENLGIAVSDCWFAVENPGDYGVCFTAFPTASDFGAALERAFKKALCKNDEKKALSLEVLTEYMYLPTKRNVPRYLRMPDEYTEYGTIKEYVSGEKCLQTLADRFVEEIEGFDDNLNKEVLLVLKNICTKESSKERLQSMIDAL